MKIIQPLISHAARPSGGDQIVVAARAERPAIRKKPIPAEIGSTLRNFMSSPKEQKSHRNEMYKKIIIESQ